MNITAVERDLEQIFASEGLTGHLFAKEINHRSGANARVVALRADEPAVIASVFKVPVLVAYARAVAAGSIDPAERVAVTAEYRTGGTGTSGAKHDVTASWCDLAEWMMTVSDNAATDIIIDRVGQAAIDAVVSDAGMKDTRISGRCLDHFAFESSYLRAIRRPGLDPARVNPWADVTPAEVLQLPTLDPRTSPEVSTARDTVRLFDSIWLDRIAPPDACAEMRAIMARQVSTQRIPSGFPPDVRVAGKTGTLEGIRNEASVVTYPDGRCFAVAVFTRSSSIQPRQPAHDRAMGAAAGRAVEYLRASE